jgi:hypothetical protein
LLLTRFINRKANHDATLSVDLILYETEPSLSISRIEVRYDPEWLKISIIPILLSKDSGSTFKPYFIFGNKQMDDLVARHPRTKVA